MMATNVIHSPILDKFKGSIKHDLLQILQINVNDLDAPDNLISSPYYSPVELENKLKDTSEFLSVLSLNCQSLNAKFDEIILFLEQLKVFSFEFSAICFQESWLKDDIDLSLYHIQNYSCVTQGYHCSKHGGLVIYLHNKYNYELYPISEKSDIWEGMFIKILNNVNNKSILLGNIYRPPKDNYTIETIQRFIDEFSSVLNDIVKQKSILIITGDFNINLLDINEKQIFREYFEILLSYGMFPTISLPTRITQNSATLIDQMFTNSDEKCSHFSGIILSDISDHLPYFYCINIQNHNKMSKEYIYHRKLNDENINKLLIDLEQLNVMNCLDTDHDGDPNKNYNILENYLTTSINKHLPLIRIKFHKHKNKRTKWITTGLIHLIKFRDTLFKKLKSTAAHSGEFVRIKNDLRTYNRILKRTIRQAKLNFYNTVFEKCKTNPKETWKTINGIIKRKESTKFPDFINVNNEKITNKSIIVNKFVSYFGQIGMEMASTIKPADSFHSTYKNYLNSNIKTHFKFEKVTVSDIKLIINNLKQKSSAGYDGISNILIKKLEPVIIKPITLIINQAISSGIFPEKLKLAKIIPLYKKDDKHSIENYRPISILP